MGGPEPARAVTDAVPPVVAQILGYECEQEGPPGEAHLEQPVPPGGRNRAQQDPAENTPEEDAADADGDIRQSIAGVIFGTYACARSEKHLERNEQQQQQLCNHQRRDEPLVRHVPLRTGQVRSASGSRAPRGAPATPPGPPHRTAAAGCDPSRNRRMTSGFSAPRRFWASSRFSIACRVSSRAASDSASPWAAPS